MHVSNILLSSFYVEWCQLTCLLTCLQAHTCTHRHTRMDTRTDTCTYIHTYIHTETNIKSFHINYILFRKGVCFIILVPSSSSPSVLDTLKPFNRKEGQMRSWLVSQAFFSLSAVRRLNIGNVLETISIAGMKLCAVICIVYA